MQGEYVGLTLVPFLLWTCASTVHSTAPTAAWDNSHGNELLALLFVLGEVICMLTLDSNLLLTGGLNIVGLCVVLWFSLGDISYSMFIPIRSCSHSVALFILGVLVWVCYPITRRVLVFFANGNMTIGESAMVTQLFFWTLTRIYFSRSGMVHLFYLSTDS
jgi:hypothetical protein